MLKKSVRVFAGLTVLLIALYAIFGFSPTISSAQVPAQRGLPPNQPQRGLIYDGLEVATNGACVGMFRVKGTNLCTHGPDPIPQGVQAEEYAPLPAAPEVQSTNAVCDGETGYRVQVMYVRASDQADRFAQYRDSIRQWALRADSIFYESALKTGGTRHIRYVLNSDCGLCQ
jgi:hypothetical protein